MYITLFFMASITRFLGNLQLTEIWWIIVTDGEKYCTEKQPVILCILCSVNHNTTLLHSSQPITLLFSSQPITQNMTNFVHWMSWKSLKMRLSSGREIQNIKTEKSRGKTGEGRVDKLGGHEWTNWGGTKICSSCDQKWLAKVWTVSKHCSSVAESNYVWHVGGFNQHFQCQKPLK